MFLEFFYFLRSRKIDVSLNEWITLLSALRCGLHKNSLLGFYYLCRMIVCRSETEFDRFDQAFTSFFGGVEKELEISDELLEWLEKPEEHIPDKDLLELMMEAGREMPEDMVLDMFREKLEEQDEQHNGGRIWVGTQGKSAFGNSGYCPSGLRVGGEGKHNMAFTVASERHFKDFRTDQVLDVRQFQMAFRRLRQFASQLENNELEFDVDGTIHHTADKGGILDVTYKPPRKNRIKVLLLMDSGGSMDAHVFLSNQLFQAATKSNHFKELHIYYFHNIIYDKVYKDPTVNSLSAVDVDWIYKNYGKEYKLIMMGDAMMSPHEMFEPRRQWQTNEVLPTGLECLRDFLSHYPYAVWLNPLGLSRDEGGLFNRSRIQTQRELPMYPLTVDGLTDAMKSLLVRK